MRWVWSLWKQYICSGAPIIGSAIGYQLKISISDSAIDSVMECISATKI